MQNDKIQTRPCPYCPVCGSAGDVLYRGLTDQIFNAPGAWDVTKGTSAAIIAVVDGGVRFDHPDLAGRLLAGYDFVSADCTPGTGGCTTANQFTTANDGDGRDPDASDPGDWVTAAEIASNPNLSKCTVEDSTWHGTHIAGIVGAAGNNAIGVAGLNWNATILPVRVSGKCGAYRSDVIDGMRWAAGLAVPHFLFYRRCKREKCHQLPVELGL